MSIIDIRDVLLVIANLNNIIPTDYHVLVMIKLNHILKEIGGEMLKLENLKKLEARWQAGT